MIKRTLRDSDRFFLAPKGPNTTAQRLSELLDCQREGDLSESQAVELHRLMLLYQQGLLRKAMALREAVRRGLREPLEP